MRRLSFLGFTLGALVSTACRSQQARVAALLGNAVLLDSLAVGMTSEGWRRLTPADCAESACAVLRRTTPPIDPYVAAADFDGDGRLDLVMVLTDGRADHVVWWHGEAWGFGAPGEVFSVPTDVLRHGGLRIAEGRVLEVWDYRRKQPWSRLRWDPREQELRDTTFTPVDVRQS